MLKLRFIGSALLFGLMVLHGAKVFGQNYPSKPIRILTSGAGGSSDFMSRLMAQGISVPLGQQIIVDNRAGIIAVEAVAKAPADGYTLLFYGSVIWMEPLMRNNVPWDPVTDFSPITLVGDSPSVLVVHPSLPVKSVKGLIALAKARPGELNYGATSIGGPAYLTTELFKAMAGVSMVHIPFSAMGPALSALIGGQVQVAFATAAAVTPHFKSGKLSALAVTSAQPSTLAPGLPTVAASGLPGYESTSIYGVFAPGKTPATIINRLHAEIVRFLNQPEVKERFLNAGVEIVGSSPEQLAAKIKSEVSRMGKLIKDAGIRAN